MLGIIASPAYAQAIQAATDEEPILFERVGEFRTDEFLEFCKGASQISLRYFIVDVTCTTKEALIRGVRIFRLRSNARIIVLASGRKPGDPVISTLVNLGVWDILTPEVDREEEARAEVSEAIQRQMKLFYNYGNASRWHYLNDDSIFREEKQAKDRRSGMKILAIAGGIIAIMSIPIAYMLLNNKGAEQHVIQPIPAVAPAPQLEQLGEMVLDLTPITTPVCPTCSIFEIEGGNTDPEQQIHGKIQGGTFYMEPSAFQAFPGVLKSLSMNPDASSSKVEIAIQAASQQGKEVQVYASGELPSIRIDGVSLPLEPAVTEEMQKGWIPIRVVLENAGYELLYDETNHTVQLKAMRGGG
ncbi:hypothetical protein [Paenibacillus sp. Soil522]|uniref:hypothetical protein n=1 Tax=Paenibacillus sp. Soil522 TaxID=1736388 RepID=UPI0006FA03F6|nr:hypothetical protein [Paenibacillus sp. Soil522]KRE45504.1 hypothetical protein ASG81_12890 [Paenibacillus sp. Soil522]